MTRLGSVTIAWLQLWTALTMSLLGSGDCDDHSDSGDPLDWLRDSVPGEPGVDYPIFARVPDTSFSCQGRIFGGKITINNPTLLAPIKLNQGIGAAYFHFPDYQRFVFLVKH